MKKLLFFLCTASLIFACTKSDQLSESPVVDALSEEFDNSNFGNYKGVFTTLDSETRATVDVRITPNEAIATLTTEAGQVYEFYSMTDIVQGELTDVRFEGPEGSFNFEVDADGGNVAITDVMYLDKPAAVMVKKNTAKVAANPVTGTYNCTNCNAGEDADAHPFFTTNSITQTFSFIFSGAAGSRSVQTQITYNGNEYTTGSGAESQLSPNPVTGSTESLDNSEDGTLSIGGTSTVIANVDWEGSHNYSGSLSSIAGFWDFEYDGVTMTGTFQANEMYISEVDSDQTSSDVMEFIEITGMPSQTLSNVILVLHNGNDDASYRSINLDGASFDANGKIVIGNAGVAGVDITFGNGILQNGADAVALYRSESNYPNDTPASTSGLISVIVYGTGQANDNDLLTALGQSTQYDEDGNNDKENESLNFDANGTFTLAAPTPGS